MVSPGEGNGARREWQREVLAPSWYRGSGGTCPRDPVEGRGASSHRAADGKHKGYHGIRERVNETAADSAEREKTSRGELQLARVPHRHGVDAGGVPEDAQGRSPWRGRADG